MKVIGQLHAEAVLPLIVKIKIPAGVDRLWWPGVGRPMSVGLDNCTIRTENGIHQGQGEGVFLSRRIMAGTWSYIVRQVKYAWIFTASPPLKFKSGSSFIIIMSNYIRQHFLLYRVKCRAQFDMLFYRVLYWLSLICWLLLKIED